MKLTVHPDVGIAPLLQAITKAKTSIDIALFRIDIKKVVDELEAAVLRGVAVRALVAHTNRGGEKTLRKLEMQLLGAGVSVSRSAEEFARYHGKIMIVDERHLHVNGFNCTHLDMEKSRSFGVVTSQRQVVQDAARLFQADCDRKPYTPSTEQLVVSPDNSRGRLATFIKGAKRQLFIYDPSVTDPLMLRLLADRKKAGVDIRIIGKAGSAAPVPAEKFPGKRLHVRAIIRDGNRAFVGSQSLRKIELDQRREVGIFISKKDIVGKLLEVFESDWAKTGAASDAAKGDKKDSKSAA